MIPGRQGIRSGTRIPVELPVHLRWKTKARTERSAQGKTEGMSGNGLFILSPVRLRHDTPIQYTILLPAEVNRIHMQLQCVGRVVRQKRSKASAGLGVVIDDYRLDSARRPAQFPQGR